MSDDMGIPPTVFIGDAGGRKTPRFFATKTINDWLVSWVMGVDNDRVRHSAEGRKLRSTHINEDSISKAQRALNDLIARHDRHCRVAHRCINKLRDMGIDYDAETDTFWSGHRCPENGEKDFIREKK